MLNLLKMEEIGQMAIYTCPTCGDKMERDLLLFIKHTDQHILAEIQKRNPQWATPEGFCLQCLNHFKEAMGKGEGSSESVGSPKLVNIGIAGSRKRIALGLVALGASLLLFWALEARGASRESRLILILPFFGAMLCFFQARRRLCVILAQKGTRDMDEGEQPISDQAVVEALRQASVKVFAYSGIAAMALTFIFYRIF